MSAAGAEAELPDAVRVALDAAAGDEWEALACAPELADTATFCAHYGVALEDSANAILVRAKSGEPRTVACVLLAHTRLDVNHTVRKRLGARRVSFASAEHTREQTGMEIGGVTPFGLPETMEIWIDSRVMDRERVVLGAGVRSAKLRVAPAALLALPGAAVVDGLALEEAAGSVDPGR